MVLAGGVVVVRSAVILQYQSLARAFVYLAGLVVLGIFVHLIRKSEPSERAGLIAALVLTLQTVFFFIFYQQMSTSLSLFALRNVDLDFTVLRRPPVDLVAGAVPGPERDLDHGAEPGAGLDLLRAGRTGKDLSIAGKFALGFAVVAAGFFTYGVAGPSPSTA
jgi:POT family proton-dependent oligopeptide transporter